MEEEHLANHARVVELKKEKQKKINDLKSQESKIKKKMKKLKDI